MNLTNLLDYSNSIYNFNEEINSIERKNENANTKPSTVIKMLTVGLFTKCKSINSIINGSFNSNQKRLNNIFAPREFVPKTHAFRDCINDVDYRDVSKVHYNMIDTMKKNKVFSSHNYRGFNVMIADGVESFETKKSIEGLHVRNHKNDTTGYYYKSLGIMYLADDVDIMIDLVPFEKKDVDDDKEHSNKVKSEGEITVFKKVLSRLKEFNTNIAVLDCMFLNAPCFNEAKDNGIDTITKLTDKRRDLYKDSSRLFAHQKPKEEYEIIEVTERKQTKYSKNSKKKNTDKSEKYITTRKITDAKLGSKTITSDKVINHPKKTVHKTVTEKVIKKVKIWADTFEMSNYNYGQVKVLKVVEKTNDGKDGTKEMYIVTTILDDDYEFIVDLMHRRWDIELKGFRKLKSRYNFDHLYIGTDNAIRLISYLTMIIYNLIELYFNIHTKKYRYHINYDNLLEDYKIEVAMNKKMYQYFET